MQGSVWELCCSLSICLHLFWFRGNVCFAYDKTVINQRRIEKLAFEDQLEENSVWIIKWTTLLGIFCKIKFYACCYILLSGTRRCTPICGAAMLLRWNWFRNLDAAYCILQWIVLILSTLHTRNSSCITLLWLHHSHKMSISYHKNRLVSSHQIVGRWLIFMCFVVRTFDETSWLSTAYLSLCHDGIRGWSHFAFMWIVSTFFNDII